MTVNATPEDRELALAPLEDGDLTLFIDGVVHRGGHDPPALLAALAR